MTDSKITLLRVADSRRARWKNGGGWTREIALDRGATALPGPHPNAATDDFRWRISIAEIEQDGPFSMFPGIDRELLLLDGAGIELAIDGQSALRLDRPLQAVRFAGEQRVHCRLIDGPTRDFNVMVRRNAVTASVRITRCENSLPIPLARHREYLIHVASGTIRTSLTGTALTAAAGDSLQVTRSDSLDSLMLHGRAELILVEFESLPL